MKTFAKLIVLSLMLGTLALAGCKGGGSDAPAGANATNATSAADTADTTAEIAQLDEQLALAEPAAPPVGEEIPPALAKFEAEHGLIVIGSNCSLNYHWVIESISESGIVEEVDMDSYEASRKEIVGSDFMLDPTLIPGSQIFVFKALKPGTATVTLNEVNEDGSEKVGGTASYKLTVNKDMEVAVEELEIVHSDAHE